jgi:hypothetical protein
MFSYVLIGFFIEIGCENIKEGSKIAFESMKMFFNLACLYKFTPNGRKGPGVAKYYKIQA